MVSLEYRYDVQIYKKEIDMIRELIREAIQEWRGMGFTHDVEMAARKIMEGCPIYGIGNGALEHPSAQRLAAQGIRLVKSIEEVESSPALCFLLSELGTKLLVELALVDRNGELIRTGEPQGGKPWETQEIIGRPSYISQSMAATDGILIPSHV